MPDIAGRITTAGGEAVATDLAGAATFVANEHRTWAPIVKELGLKAQ